MTNFDSRRFDTHESSTNFRIDYDLLARIKRVRNNMTYTEMYAKRVEQCMTTQTKVKTHTP